MPTHMTRTEPDRDLDETGWGADTVRVVHDHLRRVADARGLVEVSQRDLAAALHMSPATARRCVHQLIDAGALERVRPGTGGRYRSRYRVLAAVPAPSAA